MSAMCQMGYNNMGFLLSELSWALLNFIEIYSWIVELIEA